MVFSNEGLGIARRRLIEKIVLDNWLVKEPTERNYTYNELLFIIQEMMTSEGKNYLEANNINRGYDVFRNFVELLLYRNLANYDSMILLTSEKGCLTDDTLIEMPRDLLKYPKGIPIKELIDKGPIYVYSFNKETKKLEVKLSDGVEFAKFDNVYEVEFSNGEKIKCTDDHPFLLMNGEYKKLKDIIYKNPKGMPVSTMVSKGKFIKTDRVRVFCRPFKLSKDNYIKVDYSNINKSEGDTVFKHIKMEHRLIAEQIFGDIKNKIIHHKDGNHYNDNINNLELVDSFIDHFNTHNMKKYLFQEGNEYGFLRQQTCTCKKIKIKNGSQEFKELCKNKREEYCKDNKDKLSNIAIEREENNINSNLVRHGVRILNITYLGKQNVYDVVNVRDNHNFIANGFIVSNTGKSSAAIMIARYWCRLLGKVFNPLRNIAFNNIDVQNKLDSLEKFDVIVCDEAIRFASSTEWAKRENRELKKKLAQIRTKHLLYILCFPLKVYKLESTYLQSYVNYWIDLFDRGVGAIYIKNRNPTQDAWALKEFEKVVGSYNEFTNVNKIKEKLMKHPNFWQIIRFPKVPKHVYEKYLLVREKNVYDDDNVLSATSKEDIYRALLILALRDIMTNDTTLSMNRIILHIKNQYDINVNKSIVQFIVEDSKQLVSKVREQVIDGNIDEKYQTEHTLVGKSNG